MNFITETIGNIKFISGGEGRLDLYNRKELETVCQLDDGLNVLALDLTQVLQIDSSILGVLLNTGKTLSLRSCELVVFGLQPEVLGVFKLTRLEYIIRVVATREDVLAAYTKP